MVTETQLGEPGWSKRRPTFGPPAPPGGISRDELDPSKYRLNRDRSRPAQNQLPNRDPKRIIARRYNLATWALELYQEGLGIDGTYAKSTQSNKDTIRNPYYNVEKYGIPLDTGGTLSLSNVYWRNESGINVHLEYKQGSQMRMWDGYVYGMPFSVNHDGKNIWTSTTGFSADGDLAQWGATAWNRFKPAKPLVDLGVFAGELRDVGRLFELKAIVQELKDIGDWFLALEFGWLPLLYDIKRTLKYVDDVNEKINWFYDNAGKPVRRSGKVYSNTVPRTLLTESKGLGTCTLNWNTKSGYPSPGLDGSKEFKRCYYEKSQDIWFSGEFVFWFDGKPPPRTQLAAKLAGLEITPRVVWELIPWSWLIDWFSNLGDVISNLTTEVADHQVSNYAYIMGHTQRIYTWETGNEKHRGSVQRVFDTKVRQKVHPFGLSLSYDNLSNTQIAILAALAGRRAS